MCSATAAAPPQPVPLPATCPKATLGTRRAGLRVTALNDCVALLTAWANDAAYDRVFAEPLRSLLDPGDLVIAISASGNSGNVLESVLTASAIAAMTPFVLERVFGAAPGGRVPPRRRPCRGDSHVFVRTAREMS